MSDKEIRRQAKAFSKGLLGHGSTKSMCFVVSTALAGYLQSIGIACEAMEGLFDGWHHWWVECYDGRIIDATADQFDGHRNFWLEYSTIHKPE